MKTFNDYVNSASPLTSEDLASVSEIDTLRLMVVVLKQRELNWDIKYHKLLNRIDTVVEDQELMVKLLNHDDEEDGETILLEKVVVSESAVRFLLELKKLGGVMSRGEKSHDYLTGNHNPQSWIDVGRYECQLLKLIERADSGSEYSYIKWKISEKGNRVITIKEQ